MLIFILCVITMAVGLQINLEQAEKVCCSDERAIAVFDRSGSEMKINFT